MAFILFWALLGLAIGQGLLCLCFIVALLKNKQAACGDDFQPRAAVILCLRGADPFLHRTLESLLAQDYPKYDIHIVIDSPDDPAWEAVKKLENSRPDVHIELHVLTERNETCTLKCSSLVQTVSRIKDSYDVVALLDADTVPHRTWLSELIAPMADESVGVTTGNRCYMPVEGTWGALVRYAWNAAAIVQMYCYHIPWGGTLAFKTAVLRNSDLLDRWRHAFCEDTMLYRAMRKQGLRVVFVPSLMMVNREMCDLPGFVTFLKRQLLAAKLYHPAWCAVVGHAISISLLQIAAVVVFFIALVAGRHHAALWTGLGMAVYWAIMFLLLALMEGCVRRIVRRRGEATDWLTAKILLKFPLAIAWTQLLYPQVMISMFFMRFVNWRGIRYQVSGSGRIKMIEYRPYSSADGPSDAKESL